MQLELYIIYRESREIKIERTNFVRANYISILNVSILCSVQQATKLLNTTVNKVKHKLISKA